MIETGSPSKASGTPRQVTIRSGILILSRAKARPSRVGLQNPEVLPLAWDVELGGGNTYYGTILAETIKSQGDVLVHVDENLVFSLFGIDKDAVILVK